MGGRSTNRSLDLGMMTTTGFQILPDKASNYWSPPNTVSTYHLKSLFSILIGNQGSRIPGDNMDENKVLVCYPNPDQILAGLSSSTQKYPNHSTLWGYHGIINQVLVVLA
jgi:hypothetical protein